MQDRHGDGRHPAFLHQISARRIQMRAAAVKLAEHYKEKLVVNVDIPPATLVINSRGNAESTPQLLHLIQSLLKSHSRPFLRCFVLSNVLRSA